VQKNKYIPATVGEIVDMLSSMLLSSPTFQDDYFTDRNIDTEFDTLKTGLGRVRNTVGEEKYHLLISMTDKMRTHFEADLDDVTDDSLAGRDIILEMQDVLTGKRL
jgi:hypothetical protein